MSLAHLVMDMHVDSWYGSGAPNYCMVCLLQSIAFRWIGQKLA